MQTKPKAQTDVAVKPERYSERRRLGEVFRPRRPCGTGPVPAKVQAKPGRTAR